MSALVHFAANLPDKPYVSSNLQRITIRLKNTAINYPYIQPNDPFNTVWIVLDIDRGNESFYSYEEAELPQPNITSQNPENGNCHLFYLLKDPVWVRSTGRRSPEQYLNAVREGMTNKLKADPAYTGLICKNPLHDDWRNFENHAKPYQLAELAENLDLTAPQLENDANKAKKRAESVLSLGRNDSLFNTLRFFSYSRVKKYRELATSIGTGKVYSMWLNAIESEAAHINAEFEKPLQGNEIRTIARSVAKWSWYNYQPQENYKRGLMGFGETRHTNPEQPMLSPEEKRERQSKAAELTAKHKRENTEAKIKQAIERLKEAGKKVTQKSVSESTKLSLRTVKTYWNIAKEKRCS